MSGPKIVNLSPKPIKLGNEAFLRAVFGGDWERAHVCGFGQDPAGLLPEERFVWGGGPAKGSLPFRTDHNTFFTISVFHPDPVDGRQRRRKVAFDKAYAVVIDDVDLRGFAGTSAKVGADKVKLDPSWVLETSPGNYQLGYILGGGDARGGKVNALLDALVESGLCPDGSDPGMKGVTRYVRLPVGRNTKAKYGVEGFDHVLSGWHPSRVYTLEEVAEAYGVLAQVEAADDDIGGTGAGVNIPPEDDTLWNALLKSGTVSSHDAGKGLLHVTCPFVDEHTGRSDSGTAYLGGGRWNCHHGHCVDRFFDEFTEKFREEYPEAWKEAVRESFADLGFVEEAGVAPSVRERELREVFGDEAVEEAKVEKLVAKKVRSFWFGDAAARGVVLDMPWLVKGLIPPEGVGVLYGPPGTGKSFVALDLAARVAGGLQWQGLLVKKTGMVLYVASEGGTQSLNNRVLAWMDGNGLGAQPVLVYPGAFRLGRDVRPGDVTPEGIAKWAKAKARGAGVEVAMVVIDTLARNMTGDENATADMSAFVAACDELRGRLGAFVLLVHHSGKDASKGSRGSSALLGAVDLEMELERTPGAGNPGSIYVSKAREGDLVGRTFGYLLQKVVFGKDQDGDEVTSLYVEETTVAPRATRHARKAGVWEQAILEVYEDMVGAGNWANMEDIVARVSEWSGKGEFPNVNNGDFVPQARVRDNLKKALKHDDWEVSPDGAGIKRNVGEM